jgi:hypothetical protein
MAKAITARFSSASQADIEDHILAYFAGAFPGIPSANISAGTDLKQLFNYSDASWAAFALTLNAKGWMQQIGVRLAPGEMRTATTLGSLVALIWKKVRKLVAPAAHPAVKPLSPSAPRAGTKKGKKSARAKKGKRSKKTR